VVVEEELRGTSGRVLFNGRYIPTITAAIPCDHGAGAAGAAGAWAGAYTRPLFSST